MKIAAITENRVTISRHLGRAPFYLAVTVENGEIVDRELREKLGHAQFAEAHVATDEKTTNDPRGHGLSHEPEARLRELYRPATSDGTATNALLNGVKPAAELVLSPR